MEIGKKIKQQKEEWRLSTTITWPVSFILK